MKRLVISTAAALLGTLVGLSVVPALAIQGCGVGFHRGPSGYCRPNYGAPYAARGVYRGGAYAYRGGVYGGRVYARRGYAVRGYGRRVGHYGARYGGRYGGGRRGWR